jgi:DNA polymerase III epsilon subunit-like protein
MAIHHITEKMVADNPTFQDSDEYAELKELVSNTNNVIAAHIANLAMQMLKMEDIYTPRVIRTLKLARYLDKNRVIPKYSLQYLRYYLGLDVTDALWQAQRDAIF